MGYIISPIQETITTYHAERLDEDGEWFPVVGFKDEPGKVFGELDKVKKENPNYTYRVVKRTESVALVLRDEE